MFQISFDDSISISTAQLDVESNWTIYFFILLFQNLFLL